MKVYQQNKYRVGTEICWRNIEPIVQRFHSAYCELFDLYIVTCVQTYVYSCIHVVSYKYLYMHLILISHSHTYWHTYLALILSPSRQEKLMLLRLKITKEQGEFWILALIIITGDVIPVTK